MDDLKANAPGQAESPSALPPGYRARPATWDDLGAAVELFNACEIAEHGEPDYEENDVREEWDGLEDQQHVTLIEAPDGDLAGSLMLDKRSDTLFEAYGYVHPAHSGRGIGRWILATSEARARELTPDSAEGPTIVRNFIAGINEQANELLRVRGYTAVRKFWRMEIELTEPPDPVSWPAGFSLRDAVPGHDEPGIFAVLDESFGEHWGGNHRDYDQWLRSLSGEASTPRLWLQVFYDGKRVAIGTGKISAGTVGSHTLAS